MRIRNLPTHISTEPWFPNTAVKENQLFQYRSQVKTDELVEKARAAAESNPEQPELWVAYGRALRRHNMFREAIEAYSLGLTWNPFYAPLYRHRGHAYLNTGRFEESVGDFEVAIFLDPSDIDMWYHQGVSYFLLEEYERAVRCFRRVLSMNDDDGTVTCTSDWLYRSLMRLGRKEEAEELESSFDLDARSGSIAKDYYRVHQMYQGKATPEEILDEQKVTSAYGAANYYFIHGMEEEGIAACRRIIAFAKEKEWGAFGYRASVLELSRRGLI